MKSLAGIVLILWLVWAAGLVRFMETIDAMRAESEAACEGIVVLTGGAGRIDHGFSLLEDGRAQRMLITGVGERNDPAHFVARYDLSPALQAKIARPGVLTLDRTANSTYSNAEETKRWLAQLPRQPEALCLVTAQYHMPRSLLVFRHAMPQIRWVREPVSPDSFRLRRWWQDSLTRSLLFSEYHKYLAARLVALVS